LKNAKLKTQQFRTLLNGVLMQDKDMHTETAEDMKVETEKAPTEQEIEDLIFANKIVKHTKSNAIVLAKINNCVQAAWDKLRVSMRWYMLSKKPNRLNSIYREPLWHPMLFPVSRLRSDCSRSRNYICHSARRFD